MSLKNDILYELLNTTDYISGEYLAQKFGKSRAAVWKAIKALRAQGYQISAVTNKGYMITDAKNLVSVQSIKTFMKNDIDVEYLHSVDSTNNYCKRVLAEGKNGVFLVAAHQQTAGRGRQGKSFYSPADTGVYFSLVLYPKTNLQNAVTATTAAAVAVCKAIENLTDKRPKIKWVNDVYLDGKKICGILTEAITNFEEGIVDSIIIGIGVNISTTDFPQDIEGAGCLVADVNPSELIAKIADELITIAGSDYKSFIDYYRSHSLVIGEKIKFIRNGAATLATAAAIDETGGLVVRLEDESEIILRSGDISIRKI
ncbi:MAG: biotin--[acetyl-CoA-carboxylase] ligase [Acetobacter sp.]|nr:biotin--[acetyl-CoA-carboxylase] ligase [Bacteroides sp.]MCM1341950.1 biotin--[acetyl-CoA-carboxylase] ligase [Acetobacter sp.]MCM1434135.1 biotin--[acetyl-CoA-carboxylase] ligase [Clostridiales bacterium]